MNYQLCETLEAMRAYRQSLNGKVAVVPTMGALHEGHLSLVKEARKYADTVILTIFVNPTQFGPHEDFEKYPRDLEGDLRKGQSAGVDCFFTPTKVMMYPPNYGTYVVPELPLEQKLEGAFRPGHFRGVTTIVLKLFNIIQPHAALFGLKDYQQYLLIKKMVEDLNCPIQVVGVPIYRESDGLAMSSRNVYLSQTERQQALVLSKAIQQAKIALLEKGERDLTLLEQQLRKKIEVSSEIQIDYACFVDPETLDPQSHFTGKTLFILTVRIGKTRLLDNAVIQK